MVIQHAPSGARGSGQNYTKASRKFFRDSKLDKWIKSMIQYLSEDEVVEELIQEVKVDGHTFT